VCTIGPACSEVSDLEDLIEKGMNIARINASHGDHEGHGKLIENVRTAAKNSGKTIGVLYDTKGAEIRTDSRNNPLEIKKGQEVVFSSKELEMNGSQRVNIGVNYDGFADDVRETDRILIDNGELSFDIVSIEEDGTVVAKAKQDGEIGSRRHINLPGADVDLPSITDKDWEDIAFSVEQDVDFIALSFIRTADDVESVRNFYNEKSADIFIISKIETKQAVDNIAEIIHSSDGIMVARGDLGAEVPFEKLPAIQNEIVWRCRDAGKPVIIATHMLESMKNHPIPTRAEVTDVAHAAATGADSTMLSGETASGKHPPVAVGAMKKILIATEEYLSRFAYSTETPMQSATDNRAQSAVAFAEDKDAAAVIVITEDQSVAQAISKYRPRMPIVVCTSNEKLQRTIQLCYGIYTCKSEADAKEFVGSKNVLVIKDNLEEGDFKIQKL